MHSLPVFLRLADRPVMLLGEGPAAEAKARLLDRAGARIVGEHAAAALAIVAIEDEATALPAIARLKARGILVNAVDRPALCDFTLPSIVDRDPLLVAVGTGGASAGLAKVVRQRIEAMLPPGAGALATALGTARAGLRARWPDAGDRRHAIDVALAEGGPLDPLADHVSDAVARWIATAADAATTETIVLALRSPDPDELTLREARLLGRADRIVHRGDVPPAILARARADADRIVAPACPADPGPGLTLDIGWSA